MLNAQIKREVEMNEAMHFGISSESGDSLGKDDNDDLSNDKHEDLAEDLSFTSSSHPADSSRFDQ